MEVWEKPDIESTVGRVKRDSYLLISGIFFVYDLSPFSDLFTLKHSKFKCMQVVKRFAGGGDK